MKNRKKWISVMAGIMAAVLLLSLFLGLIPPALAASSGEIRNQINDLKAQQNQLRQDMDDLREQYEKNEDEIADLLARKALIDQEIFRLEREITELELISDDCDAVRARLDTRFDDVNSAYSYSQKMERLLECANKKKSALEKELRLMFR